MEPDGCLYGQLGLSPVNELAIHKAIKRVSSDIEAMKFNTATLPLMSLSSTILCQWLFKGRYERAAADALSLRAHMVEEMWELLGFAAGEGAWRVIQPWPAAYDEQDHWGRGHPGRSGGRGKLKGPSAVPVGSDDRFAWTPPGAGQGGQDAGDDKTVVKTIVSQNKLVNGW